MRFAFIAVEKAVYPVSVCPRAGWLMTSPTG